ncbi:MULTISPECIES: sigma 54-interacting transcriptional regulator [unclassified Treponema]|uniref:sigma 54-interacting transcriptional regulator n=1 Tax=unclassified Treponema TaxID=2638727 RepID=UPI0020A51C41|nr:MULTISPECIES: sigma 54-interacting transcriptional regulator [unclassified Treponema]UTC66371.1 sigma-54-dependent Fis family transcriptional regulator [Treponema sp. OMZ 789]UTC69101.1 sigma-54-dependent Fis family transcriptional regulator [Treponema sp. OMZ 790]UTC71813.1 sigma-54-dependent Fis family transcriptional regulator [Treponema sp. OMZ 791]
MKSCVYAAYSEEDAENFINEIGSLWNVSFTLDTGKIIELLRKDNFDFVIIDAESGGIFLPDVSEIIKQEFPHIHIFIIMHCKQENFSYDSFNHNVSGIFELPANFKSVYEKIEDFFLEGFCREKSISYIKEDENTKLIKNEIIGISNAACSLREFIYKAAKSNLPVLLLGETGSGKGLAANLIHRISAIKDKKFLSINVSCIPESLAESFLFGTEEGSFTGAVKKEGVFVEAAGGTIFLDEMETLSMDVQAKLLHVLESGVVRPVGSVTEKKVDFRLISSSNEDLKKMIKEKQFRQDLYYRLDILHHEIQPLRNKKEDIKYLAQSHLVKINRSISDEAISKLRSHNWPGNIRELYNCLDRACHYYEDKKIEAYHIEF